MQKLIMGSLSDGALRELSRGPDGHGAELQPISNFFDAVQSVFDDDWAGHKPRTSRLVHGVGIVALGYVMEYLHAAYGAVSAEDSARH